VGVKILIGDVRARLKDLPDESVHCVVTSPPYFGLRDYGHAGQIGLEPTPDAFVATMVEVFREVRRVLRKDGTLWLNLGSSYASGDTSATLSRQRGRDPAYDSDGKGQPDYPVPDYAYSGLCDECLNDFLSHHGRTLHNGRSPSQSEPQPSPISRDNERSGSGLASLPALPPDAPLSTKIEFWRQRRGECSRCDSRASGLSAVRSSSDGAQGFVRSSWLNYTPSQFKQKDLIPIPWMVAMALQADGWWLRQDIIWHKPNPMPESVRDRCTKAHEYVFLLTKSERYFYDIEAVREDAKETSGVNMRAPKYDGGSGDRVKNGTQSQTTVKQYDEIKGANRRSVWTIATQPFSEAHFATFPPELPELCIKAGCPAGGTVLDPFGGAGTTGLVADRIGRNAILIELNPEYADMARKRIEGDAGMFAMVGAE
jgi:DNA modification methylase